MTPKGFYDIADESGGELKREYSDRTYNLENMSGGAGAFIHGKEAVRQAVFKILNTERFRHGIYSSDYGVEVEDLYGTDCDYACVELERRISEALLCDERISRISDFSFDVKKNAVYASFTVYTVFDEQRIEDFKFSF